jgi:hypothetical protein
MFRRPLPKMILYGYVMSTTSKVVYLVRGFLGLQKDTGSVIALTGSIILLPEPYRGFRGRTPLRKQRFVSQDPIRVLLKESRHWKHNTKHRIP